MLFNSVAFVLFFPLVTVVYFLLPQKVKNLWLLLCSLYFYMRWKAKYILLIGFSIFVTYLGSLLIERFRRRRTLARLILVAVLAANLGVLFLFKYYGLFSELISAVTGPGFALPVFGFALPVGISFYTFQALGYSIDVYRGLKAERNPFRYALFVSFFPQLVAGPIERASNLLPQFYMPHVFDFDRVKRGLLLMGWGFFQKLFLADRLAVFVNNVYAAPAETDGALLLAATAGFCFQIYCDFASYSNIAIGAAEVLGFSLMQNFRAPFLARSVKEFWRRWHISLSTWFKDYLYIPLGGSRRGLLRTCVNLMIVFLVSGLWHGASLTFVVWGGLHGCAQVAETLAATARRRRGAGGAAKLPLRAGHSPGARAALAVGQTALTFAFICLSFIFFRSDSLVSAWLVLGRIFTANHPASLCLSSLAALGLDAPELVLLALGLALLIYVDIVSQKRDLRAALCRLRLPVQWVIYLGMLLAVTVFGVYGPAYDATPFIYFQF